MMKTLLIFLMLFTASSICYAQNNKALQKTQLHKTDAQWKQELTPLQYHVLREAGTERPFSSQLNKNYKKGIYVCAGCKTELYKSEHKFDSGTGWPSFDRSIKNHVKLDTDYKIGYARTELKCNTCDGHLGHVFNDGPKKTTGKRHCINGAALLFIAD